MEKGCDKSRGGDLEVWLHICEEEQGEQNEQTAPTHRPKVES